MSQGPPYLPRVWALGGAPNRSIDIPVTSICLALYLCGAAMHMTILQLNSRQKHKFLFSGALFGTSSFCMSRGITCSLRLSSVVYAHNIHLAIAAQIFTAAGVLIIFVINLLWTQRLVRSLHPQFGWHRVPSTSIKILWPLIGLTLAVLITATVQSFYTRRPRTLFIDRALQLYGTTFLAILSFLPIPILLLAFMVPCNQTPDNFGRGRLRTKVVILLTGTVLVSFGASYRAGTMWLTLVQNTSPLPAYYHKAAFYLVDFGVEILTVYLYAIMRVDQRFHIPDGARGPGSYSQSEFLGKDGEEKELELS